MMKWLTALFAAFILLIIVLANTDRLGVLKLINRLPLGDKLGHFTLYGILALLTNLTLFRALSSRSRLGIALVSGAALALLIGIEEISQRYVSSRTFSLEDLSASYLGLIVFSLLAVRVEQAAGPASRPDP